MDGIFMKLKVCSNYAMSLRQLLYLATLLLLLRQLGMFIFKNSLEGIHSKVYSHY